MGIREVFNDEWMKRKVIYDATKHSSFSKETPMQEEKPFPGVPILIVLLVLGILGVIFEFRRGRNPFKTFMPSQERLITPNQPSPGGGRLPNMPSRVRDEAKPFSLDD